MDWLAIVITLVGGAIGGNGLAAITRNLSVGTTGNTVTGAIGGALLTWLVSVIPGLSGIVGSGMAAGFDPGAAAGQGIVGIIGGAVLTAIAASIKNSSMRRT